jgi:hypothetical protein
VRGDERKSPDYLSVDSDCILEGEPLGKLAWDRELMLYHHHGY